MLRAGRGATHSRCYLVLCSVAMTTTAPTLAAKVEFMKSLCGPGDEVIETHFAWLFLAGPRAWKLRKPVRREPMDYRSLAARRLGSLEDVRLNRRLAPQVYEAAVPLTVDAARRLAIDGAGRTVDWLVRMQRLGRDQWLDARLTAGTVAAGELLALADFLAAFYRAAQPALADGERFVARLRRQVAANHAALQAAALPEAAALFERQDAAVTALADSFAQRATSGCIVEAHGDLRPEHVHLGAPLAVIDCLEFDRDLRILDRAEELSFFELECIRLGRADAGRQVREACLAGLRDRVPPGVLAFYRSHRAANRARLYLWRAAEPDGDSPERWLERARSCTSLALQEIPAAPA